MDFYTTQNLATIFRVSHQTVKNWAVEFAQYLSPTAKPPDGKKRLFTLDDVQVLSLVHNYKERGYTYADAQRALSTGQRGDIPDTTTDIVATAPPALIESLRDRITTLQHELMQSNSERDAERGKVEILTRLLKEQGEDKDRHIRELYQEVARLQAQLEAQGKK